jgi:predicted HD superfamily hydrolase involved in NAD metabolism
MQSVEDITLWLKKNLSQKRFAHTLGVAETARSLAEKWGENPDTAFLTGLIHDCAKEIPFDETVQMLKQSGIELSEAELAVPAILHAPLGAVVAKNVFGIKEKKILDAVRYHSLGRESMCLLEKIIYVADFIEPNRMYEEAKHVRKLAFENIDMAVLKEADYAIKFTIDRGKVIHTDTINARNYFLKLINGEKTDET